MSHKNLDFVSTSFLDSGNAVYMEQLYSRYIKDPSSVDDSVKKLFASFQDDAATVTKNAEGASWTQNNVPAAHRDEILQALDSHWPELAVKAEKKIRQD